MQLAIMTVQGGYFLCLLSVRLKRQAFEMIHVEIMCSWSPRFPTSLKRR